MVERSTSVVGDDCIPAVVAAVAAAVVAAADGGMILIAVMSSAAVEKGGKNRHQPNALGILRRCRTLLLKLRIWLL